MGKLIEISKILGLLMGILGVILYDELSFPYKLILWLPISFGYSIYFSNILKVIVR